MNLCEIEKKTVAWQTFKDEDGEIYFFDNEGRLCVILQHVASFEPVCCTNKEFISRTDFELCQ